MVSSEASAIAAVPVPAAPADETGARILDVVVGILEAGGYDAVQLREVARRSKTSLSTIYKRYETRDGLILAAIGHWMEDTHSGLARLEREPREALHPMLMRTLRGIFEPWERYPQMLLAFFRVRSAPGGEWLVTRGFDLVVPVGKSMMAEVDPDFVAELQSILSSMIYGLVARFRDGQIEMTDILPSLDRAVFWLTAGYEATSGETVE